MIGQIFTALAVTLGGQPVDIPDAATSTDSLFATIVPLIFGILGALSLLFVVIGGFRYTISAGDPANIKKARETILYALLGLIVSVSAFTITNFILEEVRPDETGTGGLVGPNGLLTVATRIIVRLLGAVSVGMVIYGAIRYILSGGESSATKAARETIIYALVGLAIAIAAQGIVTFVLEKI